MPVNKIKAFVGFIVVVFVLSSVISSFAANYTYDDANRLIQVELGDGSIIDYSYDAMGNRVQKISNVTTNNPPTADAG